VTSATFPSRERRPGSSSPRALSIPALGRDYTCPHRRTQRLDARDLHDREWNFDIVDLQRFVLRTFEVAIEDSADGVTRHVL